MKSNEVYMIQGTDYKQMTLDLLAALDLAKDIGDRSKRIGLKPNLVNATPASKGATTHPELVDGVLLYLKQNGFSNIIVLESSWAGASTMDAVRINGIGDVCQKHNVPIFDLKKDSSDTCNAAGMQIQVCSEARKLDYLINLPVVKGHCQTLITCALKNSKGLIPDSEKRRFHTLGLHKPIAHLNAAVRQDFILADNICGDLDFEEGGNPVAMNRILAFKDPVLCDSFAAEIMGYQPHDIAYIAAAERLGLGSTDTSRAEITDLGTQGIEPASASIGQKKAEGLRGLLRHTLTEPAPTGRVKELAQYVLPKDACSACYGSLIYALERLKEEGSLKKRPKESLAIGQGYRGICGNIGIGQCTCSFEKNIPGCPPKAVDIAAFLRKEWQNYSSII